MRLGFALAVLASAAAAHAETVPIAVAPFSARCFDADKLAERVRARAGDVPVSVGGAPRGSHQQVRVRERDGVLTVEVTARDARGRVVGSARRTVPDEDCATALEVATLIVARAALPLNWREAPPEHREPEHREPEHRDHERPHPTATPTPIPEPPQQPAPPPAPPPPPPPPPRVIVRLVPQPAPRPEPGTIVLRTRPPDKRWVGELAAAVYGSFPLDGTAADEPAGELSIGLRHGRLGLTARGDVEGNYSVTTTTNAGTVGLSIRRAAVGLELHADVPVRVGAIRFVLGPTLPLWTIRPSGTPSPRSTVVVSAAATARLLYHLDISRVFLTAGVTCDVAFVREELSLTGIGTLAQTPIIEIGPILGFGVNL